MRANLKISTLMFRGALGGLLGGFIFLIGNVLNDKFRMGYVRYGGALQFLALPYFLLAGIIVGSIIACIIWAISAKWGINLSAIPRAMIGASFIFLLVIFLYLISVIQGEHNTLIPPTPMEEFIDRIMYITFFGALPGIFARPKNTSKTEGISGAT
jgi:hypothetical protein